MPRPGKYIKVEKEKAAGSVTGGLV